MTQGPDVMNVGFLAIDAVYAGTMAAVGLRQAAHVPRLLVIIINGVHRKMLFPKENVFQKGESE